MLPFAGPKGPGNVSFCRFSVLVVVLEDHHCDLSLHPLPNHEVTDTPWPYSRPPSKSDDTKPPARRIMKWAVPGSQVRTLVSASGRNLVAFAVSRFACHLHPSPLWAGIGDVARGNTGATLPPGYVLIFRSKIHCTGKTLNTTVRSKNAGIVRRYVSDCKLCGVPR